MPESPNPFDPFRQPPIEPRACRHPGCTVQVVGAPGAICDAHMRADDDRRWASFVAEQTILVRESLPRKLTWAREAAPELRARVHYVDIDLAFQVVKDGRGCVLIGDSGVGKSSLACAMLDAWMQQAIATRNEGAVRKASTSRFLKTSKIQAEWWAKGIGQGPCDCVEQALNADLLVLDDLGVEPKSAVIIRILKDRADDLRRTVVTTSLSLADIEKRYGEGVRRAVSDDAAVFELRPQAV